MSFFAGEACWLAGCGVAYGTHEAWKERNFCNAATVVYHNCCVEAFVWQRGGVEEDASLVFFSDVCPSRLIWRGPWKASWIFILLTIIVVSTCCSCLFVCCLFFLRILKLFKVVSQFVSLPKDYSGKLSPASFVAGIVRIESGFLLLLFSSAFHLLGPRNPRFSRFFNRKCTIP